MNEQDQDGVGDWSPAGLSVPYSPARWAYLKASTPRKVWGVRVIRMSDYADRNIRQDPVVLITRVVMETLIGLAVLLILVAWLVY